MIQMMQYLRRVNSIIVQYEFARKAIVGYIKHSDPSIIAQIEALEGLLPRDRIVEFSHDEFRDRLNKYIEAIKTVFPEEQKDLANRLTQNEIILMVAVLEDMLKSIHREVLRQRPTLLSAERQISLGRLASLGQAKIIDEEIERAVQLLDRQTVAERAQAFHKLGFTWEPTPDIVDRLIHLRNEILHENMDRIVTGDELQECRACTLGLPLHLCSIGLDLYPACFEASSFLKLYQQHRKGK